MRRSSGNTNDTTSRPSSSISSGLALLVSTLAQIIGTRVHDNCTAENTFRANQLHLGILDAALAVALAIGLEVAEVTDVTLAIRGGTVLL